MKKLLAFLLLISFASYGQKKPSLNYVIIPFGINTPYLFPADSKNATLTKTDIAEIEKLLKTSISDYNKHQKEEAQKKGIAKGSPGENDLLIDLRQYKRQFVAILNDKKEKEVWVNCLCETDGEDWRNKPITHDGGGKCYFYLKMNLTLHKYSFLAVNGQ